MNTPDVGHSVSAELDRSAAPGAIALLVHLLMLAGGIVLIVSRLGALSVAGGLLLFTIFVTLGGYFTLQPNEAAVLILFGSYKGTVRKSGFYWANPFTKRMKISLRARNLTGEKLKVND